MAARIIPQYSPQVGTPRNLVTGGNPQTAGADMSLANGLQDVAQGVATIARGQAAERERQDASIASAYAAKTLAEIQFEAAQESVRLRQTAGPGGAGVVDGMTAWMDQRTEAALAAAPNERARTFLRDRLVSYKSDLQVSALGYETQERGRWSVDAYTSGAESAAATAALSPEMAPMLAAEQLAAIKSDPNLTEDVRADLLRNVPVVIAEAAAAGEVERDPRAALRSLNQRLGIGGQSADYGKLEMESASETLAMIEEQAGSQVPVQRRQEALTAIMSGEGFDLSRNNESGEWSIKRAPGAGAGSAGFVYDMLPVNKVVELRNRAMADIARMDSEAKQRLEVGTVLYRQNLADLRNAQNGGEVVTIPDIGEMAARLGPEQAILATRELQIGNAQAADIAAMDGKSNAEISAMLVPPTGTQDRQARDFAYNNIRQRAAAIAAARDPKNGDPGQYLIDTSAPVRASFYAWQNLSDDASFQQQIDAQSAYLLANESEQRRLGIATPMLPKALVTNMAQQFTDGLASDDPENAARQLELAAYSMQNSPTAIAELAKATGVPGQLAIDGVPGLTIKRTLAAMALEEGKRNDILAVSGVTNAQVDDAVADAFAPLVATFGAQHDNDAANRYIAAGKALAFEFMAAGASPSEAAERAERELFSDRNTVVGTYRVPQGYDPSLVESGLDSFLRNASPDMLGIAPEPGMSAAESGARLLRTVRGQARWINDQTGNGVILTRAGQPVLDADGELIHLPFSEAVLIPEAPTGSTGIHELRPGRE